MTVKYKPRYKASREELEIWYDQSQRSLQALMEWFALTQGNQAAKWGREHVLDVDLPDVGIIYRVRVRGIMRASGGVAVVEQVRAEWTDTPCYLEDLINRWSQEHSPYLQGAARALRELQRKVYAESLSIGVDQTVSVP